MGRDLLGLPGELWYENQENGAGWYHSTACLLPDGSVLSAGSNGEFNGRIYYPSYYPSTRPVVQSVDSTAHYGQTFSITLSGTPSIEKVTLIRLNATTHGFDQGQRFINCNFTRNASAVTVTGPASGGVAPPGYYMMFVIDDLIPSYARYVKVGA